MPGGRREEERILRYMEKGKKGRVEGMKVRGSEPVDSPEVAQSV